MTLSLNQGVDAVFDVPEAILYSNLSDNKVKIALLSDPSVVTEGVIRDVNPQADKQTRTTASQSLAVEPSRENGFGRDGAGKYRDPGAGSVCSAGVCDDP